MLFHERHFRFAQVFVEAALADKGCSVGLDSTSGAPAEFRLDLGFGGAGGKPGGMVYSSLFIGAGIPLERQRRLMLMIGAQGQALTEARSDAQKAFTAGLRLGLEAQTTPSGTGIGGGIFGSAGASYAPATSPPSYYNRDPTAERLSPYAEGGASVFVKPGMFSGGWQFQAGVEAAIGKEFSSDPNAMSWWRVGFTIGISR